MEHRLQESLRLASELIQNMSSEEFHLSFYGFTKEQEAAYTDESFSADLKYLKGFMVDGKYYVFEPKYDGLPEPEMSKLFWHYISQNSRTYEGDDDTWTEYVQELPKFNLRVSTVHGQGSITTVEFFDYKNVEYIARNATRLKRESYENQKRKIAELLKGLPNELDEVQFETVINGEVVKDTGVIETVYTKRQVVRYLINSSNNGKVIVFVNNDRYPNDKVTTTNRYYNDEDSFGM